MEEEWRGLTYNGVDYSDRYEISSMGKVKNIKTNKELKISVGNRGYYHFTIYLGTHKDKIRVSIHKAMAENFIPNPNNYPIVNHIDGDKSNYKLSNLEWCDYSHNSKHAYDNGLIQKQLGENNSNNKLTQEDVNYIRKHYIYGDKNFGQHGMGKKFNVSATCIKKIIYNITWYDETYVPPIKNN